MSASRRVGVEVFVTGAGAKQEFDAQAAGIRAVKTEAESAGPAASAAMNGVGTSARATAAAVGSVSGAVKLSSVEMAQANQIYQNVVRTQGANSKTALDLAAALGIEKTAVEAVAGGLGGVAEASEKADKGAGELHKKIVLGQGILSGYETVIETVLKAFGGLPLPILVLLPILNALAGHFLKLGESKKEVIKIDAEQMASSLALQDVQQREVRVNGDLFAAMVGIAREAQVYAEHYNALVLAQQRAEMGTRAFTEENVKAKKEVSILAGSLEGEDQGLLSLLRGLYAVSQGQKGLNEDVIAAAEALSEQDKKMRPLVEVVARYRDETSQSTEAAIAWIVQVGHLAPEAVELLREQLEKIEPFISQMTEDLRKLTVPKFEMKNTAEGIEAQTQAVLSGLTAAFDKGLGGSATTTNSFRSAVQSLSGPIETLDQSLKRVAGNEAAYNKLLADQLPSIRAAIELHKQLNKEFDESFKQKETKDTGPRLEMEALKAEAKLREDDLALRVRIIHSEFDLRRQELRKDNQATTENFQRLEIMENVATVEVLRELTKRTEAAREHYQKLAEERSKDLNRGREFRAKEIAEWGAHYAKQRQVREDEERKFFADQAKIEFAARANRAGRKVDEAEMHKLIADLTRMQSRSGGGSVQFIDPQRLVRDIQLLNELGLTMQEVDQQFGSASHSAEQWEKRLEILSGASVSFIGKMKQMVDWQAVLTQGINGFTSAIAGAVAGTENLGRALLRGFFQIIGEIAIQLGTLMLLAAAGFLFIPGLNWSAGALAAAGTALLVFGGVMEGLSQRFGQNNVAQAGAGSSSAAGGGSSAATGSTQREPKQPINVAVPSFPRERVPDIHFNSQETAKIVLHALEDAGVFTARSVKDQHRRAFKNAGK